ncbi:MAG TPA: hypothetical protein VK762_17885 [Polyangiaceae bacterium]|jgi:hypothetical protein|nr:hypothetical protein [Polyangiaceae bacterium]
MDRSADIEGFEHDWLAVDAAGHVGFFSSAGSIGRLLSRVILSCVSFADAVEIGEDLLL